MIVLNYPLILSTVVVPYVAAFVSWVSGNRLSPKAHAALNFASLAYGFAVFLALSCTYGLGQVVRDPEIYSIPTLGRFSFLMDASTFPALLSISLVTAVVSLYSVPYMKHRFEELEKDGIKAPSWGSYFLLYTLFSASMIGCLLGTNTIEFYIFLELTLVPSFLLIAFYGYGDRVRIAIMYLIWTHVGAVLFLLGALSVGFVSGFDFINPSTGEMLLGLGDGLPASTLYVAMWLMVVGLLVKVAVFGVHMWLPYAHAEAPTPVSALLSPCLIGIGALMLLRIVYVLFPSAIQTASPLLFVWALITMIYGGFMALVQKDFKRLLAYSSISQMGYLL
ncbi:MAG: NADH-quinone oxidoreductase subunit M, partial [Thaumarchaeota archaeon]|nr:NADH-quinone oxidoreductase subunit M [Nitrososphaerota archaeon]